MLEGPLVVACSAPTTLGWGTVEGSNSLSVAWCDQGLCQGREMRKAEEPPPPMPLLFSPPPLLWEGQTGSSVPSGLRWAVALGLLQVVSGLSCSGPTSWQEAGQRSLELRPQVPVKYINF